VTAAATWGARLSWLLVAVIGGQAVGDALADHANGVARALTVGAWAGWAVAAAALAVPSVGTLTVARVTVPGALAVAVASLVGGAGAASVLALAAPAFAATVLVLAAEFGRVWVQASAYGDEERFPLRPPAGYLAASVVSWIVWVSALIVAAVAATAGAWIGAAVVASVALGGAAVLPRRWHQLSRRWLVAVPAGLVVHDPVVLGETLMIPRRLISHLRIVRVRPHHDLAGADLTGPTAAVGIEVGLLASTTALLAPRPGRPKGTSISVSTFVVAPSRPGAVLAEAARRRLPVS
jgi:hypothetical protein